MNWKRISLWIRISVATIAISPSTVAEQPSCGELSKRLEIFLRKYNPFVKSGPRASINTIQDEFHLQPKLEPSSANGSYQAVISVDGCNGFFFLDSNGLVDATGVQAIPTIPSADNSTPLLNQLVAVQKRIADVKHELEGLEAMNAGLLLQLKSITLSAPPIFDSSTNNSPNGPADDLFLAGKYQEALPVYTTLIAATPDAAKPRLRKAYCLYRLGRYPESVQEYTEVIRLMSREPVAYQGRAMAYLLMGFEEKGLADFVTYTNILSTPDASSTRNGISANSLTSVTGFGQISTSGRSAPGTDVYVHGYTRKDGTYVRPHTRSAPRR